MTPISKIRVLVMHGEHLVDAGLAFTLSRHPDIEVLEPCTADSADALLHLLSEQRVDILITDYERGLCCATALRDAGSRFRAVRTQLVVVTSRATHAEVRAALEQGVGAYLPNTCRAVEVVQAVRKVRMGVRHVSEPMARRLLDDMFGEQLTPREAQVLDLAAHGLANKTIAARLEIELGTVKCHMRAVLEKLRVRNRTEAVVVASRRGLLTLAVPPLAENARTYPGVPHGPADKDPDEIDAGPAAIRRARFERAAR